MKVEGIISADQARAVMNGVPYTPLAVHISDRIHRAAMDGHGVTTVTIGDGPDGPEVDLATIAAALVKAGYCVRTRIKEDGAFVLTIRWC